MPPVTVWQDNKVVYLVFLFTEKTDLHSMAVPLVIDINIDEAKKILLGVV
jgi:hypothetical protein